MNKDPNLRNAFIEVRVDEYAEFLRWLRRPTTMNGISIHPQIKTSGGRDNVDSEQWIEYGPDRTLVIRIKLGAGEERSRFFVDENFLSLYREEIGHESRKSNNETEQELGGDELQARRAAAKQRATSARRRHK